MIINSILDNDLYKFTQQRAVLGYRQNVPVHYIFNNRRKEGKFTKEFMLALYKQIDHMASLKADPDEIDFLGKSCPFLGAEYLQYLTNYRFNPREVNASFEDGELFIDIRGPWERTILWEVPLMAIISELFFEYCDTDWWKGDQDELILSKGKTLSQVPAFADFGTRRRRSYESQDRVVRLLKKFDNFVGTSNVHLAEKYGVKPLGTMAHEWIMGISALEGLRYANRHATKIWSKIYKGNLGTALTDTFGSESFFKDWDSESARLYDSVRHDSGDPYLYTDMVIAAYQNLGIDPGTKKIIFSDGLTPEEAVKISKYCKEMIGCSFGIGTNLTNDFLVRDKSRQSRALNMVIKLCECNGVPVVKLSDNPGKAIGDKDALRVTKWTFFNTPLDHQS